MTGTPIAVDVAAPVLAVLAVSLPMVAGLALAGRLVLRRLGCQWDGAPSGLSSAAGFFVGDAAFLVALLPAGLGHARAVYVTAFGLLGAASLLEVRHLVRTGFARPVAQVLALGSVLATVCLGTTLALTLWPLSNDPAAVPDGSWLFSWNHFGSYHSGRYVNVAFWIVRENRIPRLQQNLGQSLLVAAHLMPGVQAPFVSLTAWLAANVAWVALLVVGMLRERLRAPAWLLPGTLIVLAGNTALSLDHALVFDNGSPILLMGYADVVAGVGSFLVFVAWLLSERERRDRPSASWVALPAILAAAWSVSAPQNVLGAVLAFGAGAVESARTRALRSLLGVAALALGAAVASRCGGALMPTRLIENTHLPFIMHASGNGKGLEWRVGMPGFRGFRKPNEIVGTGDLYDPPDPRPHDAWWLAARVRVALEMFAFPLLGMVGSLAWHRRWGILTAVCLVPVWFLLFAFTWNGYKWEVTRFLIPGAMLGMFGLVLTADVLTAGLGRSGRAVAIALLCAATLVGPTREIVNSVRANMVTTWPSLPMRLEIWARTRTPLPK